MISILILYAATLGRATVRDYMSETKTVIQRDTGIVIKFKYRPIRAGAFNKGAPLALIRYAHKFDGKDRKEMLLVRLGSASTAGQAAICGNRAVTAIRPESRDISIKGITHELGHMLGAWHDLTGVMNPAPAQPFVEFKFSEKSISEIADCVNDNIP